MQLHCTYCQTMFAISHDEMLAALQHMEQHKQKYYDAHCPKCRRANRVEGNRIALFFPDWKKTIKEMEREAVVETKVEEKTAKIVAEAGSKKGPNKYGGKITTVKKPAVKAAKAVPAKKPAVKSAKATPAKGKTPAPKKTGAKTTGKIKKK
jgi:hypothetical protein